MNRLARFTWLTAAAASLIPGLASAAPVMLSGGLDAKSSGIQETSLGDFVADAVQSAAPAADFALVPAGELHLVSLAAGQSSTEAMVQALRTGSDAADVVVVMKLTGAQVRAALARDLSREPSPYDGFLQVSGLTISYDAAKHGEQRVEKVTLTRSQTPLDAASTYSVAMPRYLADGALGYFAVWNGAPAYKATTISLAGAVTSYAASHTPITPAAPGSRITVDKS